jgi:signal peptidase I
MDKMSEQNLIPPNHPFNDPLELPEKRDRPGSKRHPSYKHLLSTIGVIIAAPIIALIMVTSVFQVYEVDGQSMETTLHDNDRLIVLKTPKTWANITGNDYIPSRYDIVVFNQAGQSGSHAGRQLIKRVIGLPGDRVVISKGNVKIYNESAPAGYTVDNFGPESAAIENTSGNVDITVPDDEIFVLGDNRQNSSDSRVFGTVETSQIVGKLSLRFYPFNQTDAF